MDADYQSISRLNESCQPADPIWSSREDVPS